MSDWLQVFVGLLAAVNPAAVALAALNGTRPPTVRTRRGIVGGAAALAVSLAAMVAASSTNILDWLDIAPETFRIAAGIVIATAGVLAVWRGRLVSEPLAGAGPDAIFPLGIPLLASPAALLATASYAADEGKGQAFAAAAVAIVLAAALAAVVTPRHRPAADAIARVTGALAVAIAAGLIVHGIRDI